MKHKRRYPSRKKMIDKLAKEEAFSFLEMSYHCALKELALLYKHGIEGYNSMKSDEIKKHYSELLEVLKDE